MSESEEDLSPLQSDSGEEFVPDKPGAKKKAPKKAQKGKKESARAKKDSGKSKAAAKKQKGEKEDKKAKKAVKKGKKEDKKPKNKAADKEKKKARTAKPKEPKEKEAKAEPVSSFSKVGQRYMTPPPGDGTRGFYESLYEENPNSLIAIKFCVEYGIFGGNKHNEVLAKYTLLQKNGHFKGTVGAIKPAAISFLEKAKLKAAA